MSGDYTTTPYFALYKPVAGMDVGTWGLHWNSNADVLDATLKAHDDTLAAMDGSFLPLTGGVLSGPLEVRHTGTANRLTSAPTHPSAAYINDQSQLFSYYVAASGGGTSGQVSANAKFYSSITGAPNQYIFNLVAVSDYAGTGGNGHQVPVYAQGIRRTVNAGNEANNPQIWSGVFECIDFTNTDSALTNYMSGLEIDMTCGNTDSALRRRGIGMYLNKANVGDVAPVVNLGLHIAANSGSYNTLIRLQSPFNTAALDLRTAIANSGHHIWFADGGRVSWNTDGSALTSYDPTLFSGTGGLHFTARAQFDGTIYTPANLTVGGAATITGATSIGPSLRFAALPTDAANDAAAASAGVPVGGVYRNGSALMVRAA